MADPNPAYLLQLRQSVLHPEDEVEEEEEEEKGGGRVAATGANV